MLHRYAPANLALLFLCTIGCSEGPIVPALQPTTGLLNEAAARFEILTPLLGCALKIRGDDRGFRPAQPAQTTGAQRLGIQLPELSSGTVRLTSGPVLLEVRPLGAASAMGATDERALVFQGAYPAADSFYVAEGTRLEEFILLHGPAASATISR